MRVEVAIDAFTEDGYESIVTLIKYFSQSRHDWVVDPLSLSEIEAYFREHAPTKAGVWLELASKATVSGRAWTAGPAADADVTVTRESLDDHVNDLGAAARLVLENAEGDGDFVLAIAHVFGADRVVTAKERHWLKFVQSGGSGEVPKVVRKEREEFKRTCRVAFLLDSDRLNPDDTSKHQSVADELRDEGVQGHVLRHREVENYVPNRILAAAMVPRPREVPLAERLRHMKVLNCEQRAHFDMKNGFYDKKAGCLKIPAEQEDLYRGLPERARVGLRFGFGFDLTRILLREAEVGKVTEADFAALGPDVCGELRAILDLMQRIL